MLSQTLHFYREVVAHPGFSVRRRKHLGHVNRGLIGCLLIMMLEKFGL